MGILANLACHYNPIGSQLSQDPDLFKVCYLILCHENDAHVLLEVTRLLSTLFSFSPEQNNLEIIKNLALFLTETDPARPSVIHQYSKIITNTLHTELLLASLQLIINVTQFLCSSEDDNSYLSYVIYSIVSKMKAHEIPKLMDWGLDRLEEQKRGVGIGMGLNRKIAKNVMRLLWLFLYYDLVELEGKAHKKECY
ncbi:uncharacterized protein BX664DRAFT_255328 [Halteromyces radiatus]|uniref:uncharacterized protein n=1 Tax=Halteromyces radiatus TaxID=101107 RepID=UPI00222127C5|nr:uncharacterized protein BX664DRAFT_255328 [Halteromyces radiatus]KAI8099243.1 hypothetical protein BX664DRAFT_255328 [Halteromyces radiatus]